MKCMSSRTPAGKQGGAGLIEILVTLFILAVGLLGVAAPVLSLIAMPLAVPRRSLSPHKW